MPYGIPCPDDDLAQSYQTIPSEISGTADTLTTIILELAKAVGDEITLNRDIINKCTSRIKTNLTQNVNQNEQLLTAVQQPMISEVNGTISENQSLLDALGPLTAVLAQPAATSPPPALPPETPAAPEYVVTAQPLNAAQPAGLKDAWTLWLDVVDDQTRIDALTMLAEAQAAQPGADPNTLFPQIVLALKERSEQRDKQKEEAKARAQAAHPAITCGLENIGLPGLPEALQSGIPLPGDEDFCGVADELATWLVSIAKWIGSVIEGVTNPVTLADAIDAQLKTAGAIDKAIGGTVANLLRFVAPAWQAVCVTIKATDLYARLLLARREHAADVIGSIWFGKAMLSILQRITLGSETWVLGKLEFAVDVSFVRSVLDNLEAYYTAAEPPFTEEASEAWAQGRISEAWRNCIWRLRGHNPSSYEPFARTRLPRITPAEVIAYGRRLGHSHDQIEDVLEKHYFQDRAQVRRVMTLYDQLPSISDHLAWTRKNVFNREYVERYSLDAGFPAWWDLFGHDLRAQGMREKDAKLHYEAHWQMPSPEQMREMVFRLRPSEEHPDRPVFSDADYGRILAEQDYNPRAVEWFRAILHRVPALSYIISMYRANVIDKAALKAYHEDLGYNPRDADRFAGVDEVVKARYRKDRSHGYNPAAIAKGYVARALGPEEVTTRMEALGWTADEAHDLMARADSDSKYSAQVRARSRVMSTTIRQVSQAIRIGIMDGPDATLALTNIGWTAAQAEAIVRLEIGTARAERVRHAIAHLRSAFHAGEINEPYVSQALGTLGVLEDARASYLTTWQLENTPRRKRRTARQIVSDLAEGQITQAEALARLTNLGYDDADRMLFLADATRAVVSIHEALASANQLSGRSRSRVLAQLQKHSGKISKRLADTLRRQEPVGTLLRWLKSGAIETPYFTARMRIYGYDDSTIERYVQQVRPVEPLPELQREPPAEAAIGGAAAPGRNGAAAGGAPEGGPQ